MKTADEVIGQLDWTPLEEVLKEHGSAVMRFTSTSNGAVAELIGPVESTPFRALTGAHCGTCQCSNIHSPSPLPDNPMSKSWHANVPKGGGSR
jgi:hypothetical protein